MTDALVAGIVGAGSVASNAHVPAYTSHPAVDLVSIADLNVDRCEKTAREHGISRTYGDAHTMFEQESLDVVSICTPPVTHEELVVVAAERGIDICCEKPLAADGASTSRMQAAVEAAGVETHMGYSFRHSANVAKLRRLVDNGVLGSLKTLSLVRRVPYPNTEWFYDPAVAGGGVLKDYLPHTLDVYIELLGTTPTVESATLQARRTSDVEDAATVTFSADDATLSIQLAWSETAETHSNTIAGSQGAVEVDDTYLRGEVTGRKFEFKHGELPTIRVGPVIRSWLRTSEPDGPVRIQRFIEYLLDGSGSEHVAPIERGVAVTKIIDDIYDIASWSDDV